VDFSICISRSLSLSVFLPHPDGLESIQVLPVRRGRERERERERGRGR